MVGWVRGLLPPGSDDGVVLGVGRVLVIIHPFCQEMKTIALKLHKHEYSIM